LQHSAIERRYAGTLTYGIGAGAFERMNLLGQRIGAMYGERFPDMSAGIYVLRATASAPESRR
jgi:hypothetical protein